MLLQLWMPNTTSKLSKNIECAKISDPLQNRPILDFGMDDLTHHRMTCICSDIKRRSFNVTLFWKSPFVVFFGDFGDWILVLGSGENRLECFWTVYWLRCACDARNSTSLACPRMVFIRSLSPLPHCVFIK